MPESREEMLRRKLHSPPELQLTAADILIADTPLGEAKNCNVNPHAVGFLF